MHFEGTPAIENLSTGGAVVTEAAKEMSTFKRIPGDSQEKQERVNCWKRKVDRVTANHYLSLTASQETSNIPFP